MALDPTAGAGGVGGGGAGGSIPGLGGGGGGNAPPVFLNNPNLSLAPINIPNLPNALLNATNVANIPDYNSIASQMMSPYEAAAAAQQQAFNAQMAALQDQIAHQRGFAEDAYGINKESDQAAYDQYMKQLIATLVGRGLGSSGAKNYYSRIRQQALTRQLALLKNQLDSYVYGLNAQLTNAQLSGQGQLAAQQAQLGAQRASILSQLPSQYPATVTHTPVFYNA